MPQSSPNTILLLTPPGAGAIAVVRLIGPAVGEFIQKHCKASLQPMRAVHGKLQADQRVIDDPVFVLHSDGLKLDINLHASPWIVHETFALAQALGFAAREGQTIERDAVDGGNEIEAEILSSLPYARSELAIRALLHQKQAWARLEQRHGIEEIKQMLSDRALENLLGVPRVAIVGRANVGKSTLANQLFGAERSITADVPGTTRDWVGHLADIDGLVVQLLDTPGQRETTDAIESAAIVLSRREIDQADLVIVVLDASQPRESQLPLLQQYPGALVVVNKVDRVDEAVLKSIGGGAGWLAVSALNGSGILELRKKITGRFGLDGFDIEKPRVWTIRQRELLARRIATPGN